jgi:hypothetical protein
VVELGGLGGPAAPAVVAIFSTVAEFRTSLAILHLIYAIPTPK